MVARAASSPLQPDRRRSSGSRFGDADAAARDPRLHGCGRRAPAHAARAHGLGARPGGSAVLHVANGLALSAVERRSTSPVQRQHLLSRAADAHVLGLDARSVAHRSAAAGRGAPSCHRVQRAVPVRLRVLGRYDVLAGGPDHWIGQSGIRCRHALRLLPVPVRALQPSRAPDDVLDAARTARTSPVQPDARASVRDRGGAVRSRAVVLVDVLRRLLPPLRCRDSWRPPRGLAAAVAAAGCSRGGGGRHGRCARRAVGPTLHGCAEGKGRAGQEHGGVLQRHRIRLFPAPSAERRIWRTPARGRTPRARPVSWRDAAGADNGGAGPAAWRDPPRVSHGAGVLVRPVARAQWRDVRVSLRLVRWYQGDARSGANQRHHGDQPGDPGGVRRQAAAPDVQDGSELEPSPS